MIICDSNAGIWVKDCFFYGGASGTQFIDVDAEIENISASSRNFHKVR